MKKMMFLIAIVLLFLMFIQQRDSLSESKTEDGEFLFITKCGKCHKTGGEAPVFAPVKYASVQWERFFEKDKHKRKKDISTEINQSELELIKKYLISHAADSDRPIAAGLR